MKPQPKPGVPTSTPASRPERASLSSMSPAHHTEEYGRKSDHRQGRQQPLGEAWAGSTCPRPRLHAQTLGSISWKPTFYRAAQKGPEARKLGDKRDKAQGKSQPRQAAHRQQNRQTHTVPR